MSIKPKVHVIKSTLFTDFQQAVFVRVTYYIVYIFRNGVTVEGATHKQVVDLIKSGGDTLTLTGKKLALIILLIMFLFSGVKQLDEYITGLP